MPPQTLNRLSTVLQLLNSLTNDYAHQTSLLLGEQVGEAPANLFENAILPGDASGGDEKKERKKRTHDPNAPKRPLTPYFLYMQHARSIIANDLGQEAPKGAVQEEGQRRWANMGPSEKQGWNNAYQYNLRLYNARVHSYKAGNAAAKGMSDEEALKYAEEYSIPMPDLKDSSAGGSVQDAIAQQLQQGGDDSAKTPKKAAAPRKRKSEAPAADADTSKANSPDKKRRRSTKGDDKEEPKKAAPRKKAAKNA